MAPSASASSSSTALIPARSTLQQKVLTEEAYTSTLSDLIRRDFFPHLERLEAENGYLEALAHAEEPGGEERLEIAVRRLVGYEVKAGIVPPTPRANGTSGKRRDETPGLSPRDYSFDESTPRMSTRGRGEWDPTPLPHQDFDEGRTEENTDGQGDIDRAPPLDGLTLSSFQAQYTSEDNASFLEILKVNEAKRKQAFKWAYDAEKEANKKRHKALMTSQLQAQAGFQASLEKAPLESKRRIEAGHHPKLITSNGEAGTVQPRDNVDQLPLIGIAETSPALDDAKSLQSWSHTARNPFFFGPDASRSTHSQRTSSLPLSKQATSQLPGSIFGDEVLQDRAPGINFRNTRLVDEDDVEEGSRGSETPRSSRIDAAIDGFPDSASSTGGSSRANVESSPRVAGYSFVSPLPSPRPGDLGEERVRQLMTKGIVVGTPRAVVQDRDQEEDQYDGSFRIPPTPSRDVLARRLTDKTSTIRKRSAATPASRTSTKRKSRIDLSPAGQSLLDRTSRGSMTSLGKSLLASRGHGDDLGTRLRRERWTPSPSPAR
jgi:protein DGCR14